MSDSDQNWLEGGRGLPPEWTWSFTADAPLVGLELARETGETVVADAAGSVYLLDRRGRILTLSRGLHALSGIAWSDAGTTGAVIVGDSTLTVLNRQLRVVGTTDLREPILTRRRSIPLAGILRSASQNAETRILNANRKTIARFTTTRPLSYARFVTTETDLISAADNGLICRHHLDGSPVWGEPWWSNIGDLCITGDGRTIFLAGLNLGIQRFDGGGNSQGTYVAGGDAQPHRRQFRAQAAGRRRRWKKGWSGSIPTAKSFGPPRRPRRSAACVATPWERGSSADLKAGAWCGWIGVFP